MFQATWDQSKGIPAKSLVSNLILYNYSISSLRLGGEGVRLTPLTNVGVSIIYYIKE